MSRLTRSPAFRNFNNTPLTSLLTHLNSYTASLRYLTKNENIISRYRREGFSVGDDHQVITKPLFKGIVAFYYKMRLNFIFRTNWTFAGFLISIPHKSQHTYKQIGHHEHVEYARIKTFASSTPIFEIRFGSDTTHWTLSR